jgi:hypothetical protein
VCLWLGDNSLWLNEHTKILTKTSPLMLGTSHHIRVLDFVETLPKAPKKFVSKFTTR